MGTFLAHAWGDTLIARMPKNRRFVKTRGSKVDFVFYPCERDRECAAALAFAHTLVKAMELQLEDVEFVARALMLPEDVFYADYERGLDVEGLMALYPYASRAFIEARLTDFAPRLRLVASAR